MNILLFALSVLPVLILLWYIYRSDKYEKEPLGLLLKAIGMGIVSVFVIFYLPLPIDAAPFSSDWLNAIFTAFCCAGIPEELVKFIFLFILIWKNKNFNEFFDGIVYAVFVSLGFACVENILYVFGNDTFASSIRVGFARALLSVPAHFLFAVIMGYYFSLAKFIPKKRVKYILLSILLPILAHSIFDAILMVFGTIGDGFWGTIGNLVFFGLFFWFDIKLWSIGLKYIKKHIEDSPFKNQSKETIEIPFFEDNKL